MKAYIIKNFYPLLILVLILLIFIQRCGGKGGDISRNTSDTVHSIEYHYFVDSGSSKPIFIKGERDTILEQSVEYIPNSDPELLKEQFEKLKQELFARNIYTDSLKIDTFGYVKLTDTIQKNQIVGRGFVNNIRIPEKTTTITNTIYPKAVKKFYIGGGISGNQETLVQNINAGLLYQSKNDKIFGVYSSIGLDGKVSYGIQSFWKISLTNKNK